MPQRHRQAVSEEGNEDVGIYPTLQLVVDRPDAQIALQAFERRFKVVSRILCKRPSSTGRFRPISNV
jgi:hypothetical protein